MWWLLACVSEDRGPPASAGEPGEWVDTTPDSDPPAWSPDTASVDAPATALPAVGPVRVYAVRHAEKDEGDDPGLTEEGQARAQALADLLEGVPLAGVYATDLRRTQETVQPTADTHGLPVITRFDPYEELAEHILLTHPGESALHAGHSYTLPSFFVALGIADPPDVDGYGQIWTIEVSDTGVEWSEAHFGE